MANSLDQILSQLDTVYNPVRDTYNNQISGLAPAQQADQAGLDATKTNAFNDITTQANRRGVAFGGIPLGEQASYLGSNYLPAVANLKNTYLSKKNTLEQAIAQSQLDERLKAYDIYNTQQANAANAAGSGLSFGGAGGSTPPASGGGPAAPSQYAVQRADKGFNFIGLNGVPINAWQYANQHKMAFRDLLSNMANSGDSGAKTALQFVGNDGNVDPRKITSQALANLYHALTGRWVGVYSAPTSVGGLPSALPIRGLSF